MNLQMLKEILAPLPLGGIRFYDQIDSTNAEALRWIEQGSPELALVVADEQTAGRGRQGRTWVTPPGAALAFTIILHPTETGQIILPRLTALGALAVRETLVRAYALPAQIKWPNDVVVQRKKICGVLAEAHWSGDQLDAVILGIGINIAPQSVQAANMQADTLRFPATCLEAEAGRPVDRWEFLRSVLGDLLSWRPLLGSQDFIAHWESSLAFRGETLQVFYDENAPGGYPNGQPDQPSAVQEGMIVGLGQDGALKLRIPTGEIIKVNYGEVRLRPLQTT